MHMFCKGHNNLFGWQRRNNMVEWWEEFIGNRLQSNGNRQVLNATLRSLDYVVDTSDLLKGV